jgi:hypothetical protein
MACADSTPPRGASWEPEYILRDTLRAKIESTVGAGRRRGCDTGGWRLRWVIMTSPPGTEDYQRNGYQNHPTNDYLGRNQALERTTDH